jgi:hypothetical protein
MSSDGRYFFFVTTKGVLDTNQLVSQLWLLDAAEVRQYLAGARLSAPVPRLLFKALGTPHALRANSYTSLITKPQWSSDSASILFLREEANGMRRLFDVPIKRAAARAATRRGENIEDFVESKGSILYFSENGTDAPSRKEDRQVGLGGAKRLTGLSLTAILHPEELVRPESISIPRDLWLVRKQQAPERLNVNEGTDQWHVPSVLANNFHPVLSPDGKAVIAAMPAKSLPKAWLGLHFDSDVYTYDKLKIDKDPTGTIWSWPWQYVYIDVKTKATFPLVNAPSAMQSVNYDPFLVGWSPDGKRVLFTNSFLPVDQRKDNTSCAVGVFTVADHSVDCVVGNRFPQRESHLMSAAFDGSGHEIAVTWSAEGKLETQRFQEDSGHWIEQTGAVRPLQTERGLSVLVKQDLDIRPSLWALDEATGREKFLWDPNPQLVGVPLGDASVYRWKDATGYQWAAGLVRPPGYVAGRRYPLVIQTHGFNNPHEFLVDGSYTTGFAARALAAAGFLVVQMGDRSDRHIRPASEEGDLMADAFRDLVASLDREGMVDTRRVGIIGFSRTSWYVEDALVRYPTLFHAATIIDGVDQSYMTYLMFCPEYRECQVDKEAINGGPPFGPSLAGWVSRAPGFQINKIQTPIRIEAIRPMSILEEWELYASLRMQNKPVELIYIPDGQHILQKPWERFASQQGNVDWFRKWLMP